MKDLFRKVLANDIVQRALKTGAQVTMSLLTFDVLIGLKLDSVETALVAGGSAAASVIWNGAKLAIDKWVTKK